MYNITVDEENRARGCDNLDIPLEELLAKPMTDQALWVNGDDDDGSGDDDDDGGDGSDDGGDCEGGVEVEWLISSCFGHFASWQTDRQTNGQTLVIVELLLQLEVKLDNLWQSHVF